MTDDDARVHPGRAPTSAPWVLPEPPPPEVALSDVALSDVAPLHRAPLEPSSPVSAPPDLSPLDTSSAPVAERNDGSPGEASAWPSTASRGRRTALVAGAVALLLAGLGGAVRLPAVLEGVASGTAGRSAAPDTAGAAARSVVGTRGILTTMTGAVARRDGTAFRSVAAADHPAMRDRLGRLYTALTALPLDAFTLQLDDTRAGVPVSRPEPGAVTVPVRVTYRLRGWDVDDATARMLLVAAPDRSGRWGLVDDRTVADAGADRLEPWLFDGTVVTTTPHVLVVGDVAHRQQTLRLASTLEAVAADVRRTWPERTWNGKVVAYAVTAPAFVRSWYGRSAAGDRSNGERASFVAKVAGMSDGGGGGAVRLVVTPYLLQSSHQGYIDILRHEMTHVATARLSEGVPVWLVEGAAEYTGFARRSRGRLDATRTFGQHGLTGSEVAGTAAGTWRPTLVTGSGFYTGSEKTVDEHYNSAFITCLYIADHYGEAALRRLYTEAARPGASPVEAALLLDDDESRALRTVLHTDRGHLVTAVSAYATRLRHRLVFH